MGAVILLRLPSNAPASHCDILKAGSAASNFPPICALSLPVTGGVYMSKKISVDDRAARLELV
ncbi:MAG: hypothetical protein WA459_25350, partial [Stellaceae bacterium]